MEQTMATTKFSPVPKLTKPQGFTIPKEPQGHPNSGASAVRSSASGYGKLFRPAGGETTIQQQPPSKFRASYE
jgi:hypothetical protein